jgi:predicted nucleic acid-binding protein
MPLCDTLLRLAEEPSLYRPLWSETILQEVGKTLGDELKLTAKQRARRKTFMRHDFPESLVAVSQESITAIECIPDPNDRHVLAAAVSGEARAIITQNVRHFSSKCLDRYGVICETPDDFLTGFLNTNPFVLLDKIDAQAAAIRENRSTVLSNQRRIAPRFVKIAKAMH